MKNKVTKIGGLAIACIAMLSASCSKGNKQYVMDRAAERWQEVGFEVVGYEGSQFGLWGFGPYGGAKVWYRLNNMNGNNITYSGYLYRWGNEIHVYGPRAIDAIQPQR